MSTYYRVNILEERLQELIENVPGLRGAVIVSSEGFVVAAYPYELGDESGATNMPQIAALAATLIALGETTLARLGRGAVERLLVEGELGAIVVYPINGTAALSALLNKDAKVGLTLLAVARAADNIGKILL